MENAQEKSIQKKLADAKLRNDFDSAIAILDRIPKEVLDYFIKGQHINTPTKEDQR